MHHSRDGQWAHIMRHERRAHHGRTDSDTSYLQTHSPLIETEKQNITTDGMHADLGMNLGGIKLAL